MDETSRPLVTEEEARVLSHKVYDDLPDTIDGEWGGDLHMEKFALALASLAAERMKERAARVADNASVIYFSQHMGRSGASNAAQEIAAAIRSLPTGGEIR